MRVLHLGKYYPPGVGGMENFLRDLAVAQRRAGLEVHVLSHHHASFTLPVREILEGIEVVRSPVLGRLCYAPLAPFFGHHLRQALRDRRPDVLHVHVPNASAFHLLPLRDLPPIVLHWHADVVPSIIDRKMALLYPPYRILETLLLRKADRIVVTSPDYLEASVPLRPFRDKCDIVPLGMDFHRLGEHPADKIEALRARYGGPFILSVGRFTYYKGFSFLVEAARLLPQARFVLAGDGPLRPGLQARVREAGLADRVFLPGFVSDRDLQTHLAACDVFCLCSIERTEAFGLALVEAMAYGRPVVTTRIPGSGVNYVNEDGITGLSVPLPDPAGQANPAILARTLGSLLEDPAARQRMGEAARERAWRMFHVDAVVREITATYVRAARD